MVENTIKKDRKYSKTIFAAQEKHPRFCTEKSLECVTAAADLFFFILIKKRKKRTGTKRNKCNARRTQNGAPQLGNKASV